MGITPHALLSPELAIRLEKAFGANMEALMRMQNDFDIVRAREDEIEVARYVASVTTDIQP